MKLTRFEDIEAWKEARLLTKYVYQATNNKNFKKDLRLSGQIQAASGSVMANIAEGFIRHSDKEFTISQWHHAQRSRAICTLLWIRIILERMNLTRFTIKQIRRHEDQTDQIGPNRLNRPDRPDRQRNQINV